MWECGLKCFISLALYCAYVVAPHVGVWIEILKLMGGMPSYSVAPHVGVWIEILKVVNFVEGKMVAPHVGVWIEIMVSIPAKNDLLGRSPCGSVD